MGLSKTPYGEGQGHGWFQQLRDQDDAKRPQTFSVRESLTHARMALLNKTETVGDISTTRPITILAPVYRLRGKMMTKKMLGHILPHLPANLPGSVPGRSSADMTAAIQIQMEESLLMKTDWLVSLLTFPRPTTPCPDPSWGVSTNDLE